jgi:hypothetical protein
VCGSRTLNLAFRFWIWFFLYISNDRGDGFGRLSRLDFVLGCRYSNVCREYPTPDPVYESVEYVGWQEDIISTCFWVIMPQSRENCRQFWILSTGLSSLLNSARASNRSPSRGWGVPWGPFHSGNSMVKGVDLSLKRLPLPRLKESWLLYSPTYLLWWNASDCVILTSRICWYIRPSSSADNQFIPPPNKAILWIQNLRPLKVECEFWDLPEVWKRLERVEAVVEIDGCGSIVLSKTLRSSFWQIR